MRFRLRYLFVFSTFFAGCGGEPSGVETSPSEVTVSFEAPREASYASMSSLTADAAVEALGRDEQGRIIAVAGGHTYEVSSDALQLRNLYAGPGDPRSMGRVHALAPKRGGGAWIAAGSGLFVLDTLYVVKSPLVVGPGALHAIAEVESGALAGLWVAGEAGLFRHQGSQLEKYPVEVLESAVFDGLAVQRDGNAALVLAGGELAVLSVDGQKITSDRPPLDAGTIYAVAAGATKLYAASAGGLLRFDRGQTPKWTRFALGTPAVEVHAVTAEGDKAYARTADSLLLLEGDSLTKYPAATLSASEKALLSTDALGDVWLTKEATLQRVTPGMAGERVSFEAEVQPWIAMYCSRCHQNQTQDFEDYAVFKERAEEALARVRSGDMPRCDGGLPCSTARLEESAYQVLASWIRDGKVE
jgi:hypothetical protein